MKTKVFVESKSCKGLFEAGGGIVVMKRQAASDWGSLDQFSISAQ